MNCLWMGGFAGCCTGYWRWRRRLRSFSQKEGVDYLLAVPSENELEARMMLRDRVWPVESIKKRLSIHWWGGVKSEVDESAEGETIKVNWLPLTDLETLSLVAGTSPDSQDGPDLIEVKGHAMAKRALEVAAAGGHHLMLIGPPGSGKTMLSRCLPSILPSLSLEECLEVTRVYSIAGLLGKGQYLIKQRPFRAPHHTCSAIALVGGGRMANPGGDQPGPSRGAVPG